MNIDASYAFLDAFNTNWPDNTLAGATGDLSVNPVAFASKNKIAVTTRFHADLPGNNGELVLAPSLTYQSKYYTTATAVRIPNGEAALVGGQLDMAALGGAVVPAFTLIDLRAEWNRVLGSRIDAAVNVTNLTNKLYYFGNDPILVFGSQSDSYGPPRMITFELRAQF